MSAPSYVPQDPVALLRYYESPPRLPEPWPADRVSEHPVGTKQLRGSLYGNHGPGIGYAYRLVHHVEDRMHLLDRESAADAQVGVTAVAMRRASLFARAPVLADLEVGCTVWGFFDPDPPEELRKARRSYFEQASGHHHYALVQSIAGAVPDEVLRRTLPEITAAQKADWSSVLDLG